MITYNSLEKFTPTKKTILTIGTFDGVHLGHQKILEKLTQNADELNCESLVLSFFPHPRMILQKNSDIKLLNTISEKATLLEKSGINHFIVHPFSIEFSKLDAEAFVKNVLVEKLNIKKIIIGHDHRFGTNRSADINDLIIFGKKYNFEVEQITAEEINEVSISSTKIRNALINGEISLANKYLGYPYFLIGTVIKGKQLGQTIGFPTANININEDYKLIPKDGVYAVKCYIDKIPFSGMINIGTNPTVSENDQKKIEVNIFDFNRDIYNHEIEIQFIERLRDETKFNSLAELKNQLNLDKEKAISIFNNIQ